MLDYKVWYCDVNKKEIMQWNVFEHYSFDEECKKEFINCKTFDEFSEHIKSVVHYYFWRKCEYEVIICDVFYEHDSIYYKTDVYEQIMMNYDLFIDYTYKQLKKELYGN